MLDPFGDGSVDGSDAPSPDDFSTAAGLGYGPGGYCGPNGCGANGCAGPGGGNFWNRCGQCGGMAGCCRCCQCGLPGRFWVRDEYLGFWTKGDALPVLVTTTPSGTLPAEQAVFGGNTVNGGYRSGNWIQAGMWLDCCRNWGLTGDYFFLGQATTNFYQASDGNPVLARPYTNANTGVATQQLTAFPGEVVGSIAVVDSTTFQGAGFNLLHNLCCWTRCCDPCNCCCTRIDGLVGFRYYNLGDNLGITDTEISLSQTSGVPVGTVLTQVDSFRTQNNFYGGTLGLMGTHVYNRWVTEGTAQVALGGNHETISINGSTTAALAGQPTVVNQGGLLALSSNIGHYSHNNFSAIPMINARVGYRLTPRLTAFVGYTFIYWGQVARAGDQVNTTVNPNLIPPQQAGGPNQPSFTLHEVSFWAQGITLGGQLNF